MWRRVWVLSLAVAAGTLGSGGVLADGVKVEPGKWEMKTTMRNAMLPAPQTRVTHRCITDAEMKPDFLQDESSGCTIVESEVSGSTLKWVVSCPGEAGEMRGEGQLTSRGKTMSGTMKMVMDVRGQKMSFDQSWEGRHVGPCD